MEQLLRRTLPMRASRPDCDGEVVSSPDHQAEAEPRVVTEAEWQAERARARRIALISSALGFVFILCVPKTSSGS